VIVVVWVVIAVLVTVLVTVTVTVFSELPFAPTGVEHVAVEVDVHVDGVARLQPP